jgi:hypothetical protein
MQWAVVLLFSVIKICQTAGEGRFGDYSNVLLQEADRYDADDADDEAWLASEKDERIFKGFVFYFAAFICLID